MGGCASPPVGGVALASNVMRSWPLVAVPSIHGQATPTVQPMVTWPCGVDGHSARCATPTHVSSEDRQPHAFHGPPIQRVSVQHVPVYYAGKGASHACAVHAYPSAPRIHKA